MLSVYIVGGLAFGLAAWQALGRTPNADPNQFQLGNLDSITAVVLGGTSLFGGRGSVLGTLMGALVVAVLRSGLTQMNVDGNYQDLATGALLIAAVVVGTAIARRQTQVMTNPSSRPADWSNATAGSPPSTAPTSHSPAKVLAVVGDNGAGKSSLIKTRPGLIPDEGEIKVDGQTVHFKSPLDARHYGIETAYQDLAVAPALDIASNMSLGREKRLAARSGCSASSTPPPCGPKRSGSSTSWTSTSSRSGSPSRRFPAASARVSPWPARPAFGTKAVIMDEPPPPLGVAESGKVLDLIRAGSATAACRWC